MRGTVDGLTTRLPLGRLLPMLYQDDHLALRFTAALDEVLAPAVWALDDLDAYFDPNLAPPDFLEWVARWLGIEFDQTWPDDRRRAITAGAADLYRWQGTLRAIARLVEIHTGVVPEVDDSGGVTWSVEPGGKLPGAPDAWLHVRLRVPDPRAIDTNRLERVLQAAKPAGVVLNLEVVRG
ncbi:MAG: phage tail protein [Acidimicrobiia bacterium]